MHLQEWKRHERLGKRTRATRYITTMDGPDIDDLHGDIHMLASCTPKVHK